MRCAPALDAPLAERVCELRRETSAVEVNEMGHVCRMVGLTCHMQSVGT